MIAELGHFALILALLTAFVQGFVPLYGAQKHRADWMALADRAAALQFALVSAAFAALIYSYVTSDFSVQNVMRNSHTLKPLLYKISGTWGNHEGSMLLWAWMLALWGFAVSRLSQAVDPQFRAQAAGVMGLLAAGFLLFILFTSNPFLRIDPAPREGMDLNPLLQDPALALHPPLLYAGYVGFSVAFSFSIAALLSGKIDAAWARFVRPWVLATWAALTAGIALGSFWAYYELGWGGFWFWDPVENASLMPWLAGTALLHSLAVLEKRGQLRNWTIFMSILSFSLALLGTFLVRSGVLTSVHAFASDPSRGIAILVLLFLVTGGALLIYGLKASTIEPGAPLKPVSRETTLLLNNVFLFTFLVTVFIGTLYPVLMNALDLAAISVGAPYYKMMMLPLLVPFALLMGAGPMIAWGGGNVQVAGGRMVLPFFVVVLLLSPFWDKPLVCAGFFAAGWIFVTTAQDFFFKTGRLRHIKTLPNSFHGMTVAHLGFAVMLAGMTAVTQFGSEKIVWMKPGDSQTIAGHDILFVGAEQALGRNYNADRGIFRVDNEGYLTPEQRWYPVTGRNTSEAALQLKMADVFYLVMGETDDKGRHVVRMYYHPYMALLYAGAGLMAAGAVISLWRRRAK